jgi:hypothetical protein
MSKTVTIQFRREVEVDLNAYYPSFPKALRTAIDNELFKLLGGTAPQARIAHAKVAGPGPFWVNPDRPEFTRKGTKTEVLVRELERRFQGEKFTREQMEKTIRDSGVATPKTHPSTWVANLLTAQHIKTAAPLNGSAAP